MKDNTTVCSNGLQDLITKPFLDDASFHILDLSKLEAIVKTVFQRPILPEDSFKYDSIYEDANGIWTIKYNNNA